MYIHDLTAAASLLLAIAYLFQVLLKVRKINQSSWDKAAKSSYLSYEAIQLLADALVAIGYALKLVSEHF